MPKIYRYFGFTFAFFVKDHVPIHVHVSKQQRESKIELHYTKTGLDLVIKKVKGRDSLTSGELVEAEAFVKKYNLEIVQKWNQVFVFNKTITCDVIKQKI